MTCLGRKQYSCGKGQSHSRLKTERGCEMSKIHDDLQRLVNLLPEEQAIVVKQLVELLIEKGDIDSEPLSPSELSALERGKEQAAKGETISLEDLERELDQGSDDSA